ncbi:protocatechuate 3,4-dioxygenase subunit alpha [Nonomuraea soli]|uniref:Protocatechuate 3,4-dioxygenase alpha subunit n=1 Tax=Nonomuraea soli TaxID=1032476 RepID=A0A7W0HUU2_9ACTN|nr:protocatechuate 3,4-dioxygenase subunit alpha [Nonomuraea soli]MBA2896559.1 protocatechuate 3,4-dioxygenase alpha subunit [Nonomuraea soli]
MNPTPSQTVGPFYGYALPFPGGGDVALGGIVLHGYVYDGAGEPVPDALLETWQPTPGGPLPGSMRRDPVTGAIAGRHGVDFTGWGRVSTDASGRWVLRTADTGLPYISICVFARGLGHHLYTRAYLRDEVDARIPPGRRSTVLAAEERPGVYRFDIRLQGEGETVFLEFG